MNLTEFITEAFAQGGGSYGILLNEHNPNNGFMVATIGNEEKIHINPRLKKLLQIEELRAASEKYIINKLSSESAQVICQSFLGLWYNKQDRFWYLDLSEHITDKEEAIALGIERKQIAIWDCEKGEEITL